MKVKGEILQIGPGGDGQVSIIAGTVLNFAALPDPPSLYENQLWYVSEASGGFLSGLGIYKYPKGLYTPNPGLTAWELVPINVKVAEDSTTLISITDWAEFLSYAFDISIGDRVIFLDKEYKNKTGNLGTAPDVNTTDWERTFPLNTIIVAKSGGDFTSVKAAFDSITDSSQSNQYSVQIFPGTYLEDPMTVPQWIDVLGFNARLEPNNQNSTFITCSQEVEIKSVNVLPPDNATAILFSGINCSLKDMSIERPFGLPSATIGLQINNTGAIIRDVNFDFLVSAIVANADQIGFANILIAGCGTALTVTTNGGVLGANIGVIACTTDLVQEGNGSAEIVASRMQEDKFDVENWDNIKYYGNSDKLGDEALIVYQELHVGTSMKGYESVFGKGDSHTFEYVYTFDGTATYTDQTAIAQSPSASSFPFDGVTAGNMLYIANRYPITFEGIKVALDTAAVIGSGEIIAEFYNGGSWEEFNGCTVKSSPEYLKYAKNYFNQVGSYHLKYNPYIRDAWAVNDPVGLGTDYYWMRFRIVTAITTSPVIQQIKIHTDRFEINTDGTREAHMDARVYKKLPVDAVRPIEGNMQNASIYVDENVGVGLQNNRFTTAGDLLGVSFELPEDCDTSAPLIFVWKGKFASTGDVNFTARRNIVKPGDSYTNTEPAASGNTLTKTTGLITISTADVREDFRIDLDISDAIPSRENGFGDEIWITLQYPTRGAGNFDYTKFSVNYLSDFAGRHVRQ